MLPGPCCHHGAQAGSLPTPLTVFTPYCPNGSYPCFFYDRQCYFQRSAVAGKHHRSSKAMRKDTERNCASHKRSQTFRVFILPGYSIFAVSQTTPPFFFQYHFRAAKAHLSLVSRRSSLTYSALTYSALNTASVYQTEHLLYRWSFSRIFGPAIHHVEICSSFFK